MIRMIIQEGRQIRVAKVPNWLLVLVLAGAMFLGFLVLMVAAGLALVVVPATIIAAGISTWLARRRLDQRRNLKIIEGNYRVIGRNWRD